MGKLEELLKMRKELDQEILKLKNIRYNTATIGFYKKELRAGIGITYNIEINDYDKGRDKHTMWRTVARCKDKEECIRALENHKLDTEELIEYLKTNDLDLI